MQNARGLRNRERFLFGRADQAGRGRLGLQREAGLLGHLPEVRAGGGDAVVRQVLDEDVDVRLHRLQALEDELLIEGAFAELALLNVQHQVVLKAAVLDVDGGDGGAEQLKEALNGRARVVDGGDAANEIDGVEVELKGGRADGVEHGAHALGRVERGEHVAFQREDKTFGFGHGGDLLKAGDEAVEAASNMR